MSTASPTWGKIKAYAEQQIQHNRDLLEGAQADTLLTIQARIRVWREVLDLPTTIIADQSEQTASGY